MERTIIPKDCCLCDVCNAQLTDGNFIATADSWWHEGWLYCAKCKAEYNPSIPLVMVIKKGDDISHTDLAKPMIFESFD